MKSLTIVFTAISLFWGALKLDAQTPNAFPYQGYLEFDGAPYNQRVNMLFFITNVADRAVNDQGAGALWHERINNVPVNEGNFVVVLGNGRAFPGDLYSRYNALYLGVKVFHNNQWVELRDRQRLLPVPYALHAKRAEQADVATTAIRADDFIVSGTLTAPVVQGQMRINGGESEGADSENAPIKISNPNGTMVIDDNEIESSGTLYLQYHGNQATRVGGTLFVDNNLQVGDNFFVDENLIVSQGATVENDVDLGGNITLRDRHVFSGFTVFDSEELSIQEEDPDELRERTDDLGSAQNTVCFLSTVDFHDMEDDNEGVRCSVYEENENWILKAEWYHAFRAHIKCKARCLSWGPREP